VETSRSKILLWKIQKLIGERMEASKRTKPCFYISAKADLTELMLLRPKLRKHLGVKVTTNTFYIHSLGLAVREYPLMVGRFEGDHISIAEQINVGFAVNAPQGLLVPVIKDADKKSLAEIAHQEKELIEKARDNNLSLADVEGETIGLSNLGAFGIESFIGIVPPQASCILSVGNVIPEVVNSDGRAEVRRMVNLTLAVDRRVIEESYAAGFLSYIKERLQNPEDVE